VPLEKCINHTLRRPGNALCQLRFPHEHSYLDEECFSPIKIRALVALRMFHYISRDFRSLRLDNALFGVGRIDAMVTPLREGRTPCALTRPTARSRWPGNVLTPLKRDRVPTIIKVSRSPRRIGEGLMLGADTRRGAERIPPTTSGVSRSLLDIFQGGE